MKKFVFFTFQAEKMCFLHALFNAVDMHSKGIETKLVIEGKSTALIKTMIEEENPVFKKVRELALIDAVCMACAKQMGVLEFVQEHTDLPLNNNLVGHPPMEPYVTNGYEIVTL